MQGWPVAHAAQAMGVSRQCAHRWVARWDAEGDAGLVDRSSRPRACPTRTRPDTEQQVIQARIEHRVGPDRLAQITGVPARTITRILRRHQVPVLRCLDPITGELIRSSKATAHRYEHDAPGDLVHVDVKKLGRIPDGGGWRVHGRDAGSTHARKNARIGFDYLHAAVDDHSRLAYVEIHPDERADTCAGFIERAANWFADHGVPRINRVMTDNHFSYTRSHAVAQALAGLGTGHIRIKAHCPWQNGKVERFIRTLQTEWAYRRAYTTNQDRAAALAPWLDHYNTQRRHTALGGHPPISRLSPTS
jgi:transposase InsO family protein